MKRYATLAVIAVGAAAASLFAYTGRNFRYFAELGTVSPAALYRVHLTEEVLSKSAAGCPDVRVFDAKGKEVPRVIIIRRDLPMEPEEYSLEITGYDAGTRTITARFPDKAAAVNSMTLDIPDSDFRRRVSLYGSMDGKAWTFLQRTLIYDYTSQINLRSVTIRFPLSRYRYYRAAMTGASADGVKTIRLAYGDLSFEVDSGGRREIKIDDIAVSRVPNGKKEPQYDARLFPEPAAVPVDEGTGILIEAKLPVDRIQFTVTNPLFYRRVLLYGGEDKRAGSFLTEGMLFHAPTLEQSERRDWILCNAEKHRFYLFKIVNGDNPPLRIESITLQWHPRLLFFMSDEAGPYTLRFGNAGARPPEYDLANFIDEGNWETKTFRDLACGAVRERSDYSPGLRAVIKDGMERWILTAAAVLVAGIIGFWLYRLVRGAKK